MCTVCRRFLGVSFTVLITAVLSEGSTVGNTVIRRTSYFQELNTNTAWVLQGSPLTPGVFLTNFKVYIHQNFSVQLTGNFLLWERLYINQDALYRLKYKQQIRFDQIEGIQTIRIYYMRPIGVNSFYGWSYDQAQGPVSMETTDLADRGSHLVSSNATFLTFGSVVNATYRPFIFSAQVDIDSTWLSSPQQGLQGEKGTRGPAGQAGSVGSSGDAGSAGDKGDRGPEGPRGAPGDQGQKGIKGAPGEKGDKGVSGGNGPIGAPGAQGNMGEKGNSGTQGPKGHLGLQGVKGPKGLKGALGLPGVVGAQGIPAINGSKGDRGPKGNVGGIGEKGNKGQQGEFGPLLIGEKGAVGPAGNPGPQGPSGESGVKGGVGEQGHKGAIGPPGPRGPSLQGTQGPIGPTGDPGPPGEKGEKGDKGPPGYGYGMKGFKGSRGSPGDPGPQGDTGSQGPKGDPGGPGQTVTGPPGNQGVTGAKGEKGMIGLPGPMGPTGIPGPEGPQGSIGAPGDKGEKGQKGIKGDKGDPGVQGNRGLEGDVGPKGPKGPVGPRGPVGVKGQPAYLSKMPTRFCSLSNGGCQHTCTDTFGSYFCSCNPGYKLMKNGKDCEDVDECMLYQPCDHICTNQIGSFICSCHSGYTLENNKCYKWELVFKATTGASFSPQLSDLYSNIPGDYLMNSPPIRELNDNIPAHAKSAVLDNWEEQHVTKVKLGIYIDGVEQQSYIFHGTKSDKYSWFNKSRILTMTHGYYLQNLSDFPPFDPDNGAFLLLNPPIGSQSCRFYDFEYGSFVLDSNEGLCNISSSSVVVFYWLNPLQCSFDYGTVCKWEQDKTDDFDWSFGNESSSQNTGPPSHADSNRDGMYVYTDGRSRAPGDTARLVSPVLQPTGSGCFRFSAFMFGIGIGSLKFYSRNPDGVSTYLARLDGAQAFEWQTLQLPVSSATAFSLIIEGVVGPDPTTSDIAIDNTYYFPYACGTPQNICAANNGGCEHKCHDMVGNNYCTCNEGFSLDNDGRSCSDIDECSVYHPCEQNCTNNIGSFFCSCRAGFMINSNQNNMCDDIDECATNQHSCNTSQQCINTLGSYVCSQTRIVRLPVINNDDVGSNTGATLLGSYLELKDESNLDNKERNQDSVSVNDVIRDVRTLFYFTLVTFVLCVLCAVIIIRHMTRRNELLSESIIERKNSSWTRRVYRKLAGRNNNTHC